MKKSNSILIFTYVIAVIAIYSAGCSDSAVSPPGPDPGFRQARSEKDFFNNKDLRAEAGAVIVLDLEDLDLPPELLTGYDLDEVGIDVVPFTYTETAEHSFRLGDSSYITAKLINENTKEVVYELKPGANEISVTIPAGNYFLYIESLKKYGTDSLASQVIFIQPDIEKVSQRGAGTDRIQYDPNDLSTLIRTKSCFGCDLSGANLSGANLKGAKLQFANLTNANLSNANLSAYVNWDNLITANLSDALLSGANLSGANLWYANLADTYFDNANLSNAYLKNAYLKDSFLAYAKLINADLREANFTNANMAYADLKTATLWNANLSYAVLRKANLSYADFSYANLSYANFCDANKTGIIRTGVIANSQTQCWP